MSLIKKNSTKAKKWSERNQLFLFILLAAISSIILLNLLTTPIALFAQKAPSVFTSSVLIFFAILFCTYMITKLIKKAINLKKEGQTSKQITLYYFLQPLKSLLKFLFAVVLIGLIITIIVLLFNKNFTILQRLFN